MTRREMPMFPLGTVLFPSAILPLHVFEPRYRALARRCIDGGEDFGVVLIERGSEVGGGDVRSNLGSAARIVEAQEFDDGRFFLVAVGTHRIRVDEWLPDDPYPRAMVEDLEDLVPADDAGLGAQWEGVLATLRRALALAAELGEPAAPATVELAESAVVASFQAASVAPLGPVDKQRILAVDDPGERLDLLAATLADAVELMVARLAMD